MIWDVLFLWLSQQETGIDMNYIELYKLIESLDRNKDGEINYRYVASVFIVMTFLGTQLIVWTLFEVHSKGILHNHNFLDVEKDKSIHRMGISL